MRAGLSLRVLGTLLMAIAAVKLMDWSLVQLNARKIILPQFDVRLIPTHDPRVTKRLDSVLRYERPPRIIFTGDSRTKCGIDPDVIGRTLGVPPESFFNFGTGSQTVRFTRQVFLPELLLGNGIRTETLVFGVSPDWLLTTDKSERLIRHYRAAVSDPGRGQSAGGSGLLNGGGYRLRGGSRWTGDGAGEHEVAAAPDLQRPTLPFAEKGIDAAESGGHRILGRPGHRSPGSSSGRSRVRTAQDRGSD